MKLTSVDKILKIEVSKKALEEVNTALCKILSFLEDNEELASEYDVVEQFSLQMETVVEDSRDY